MEDNIKKKNVFGIQYVAITLAIMCEIAWGSAFPLIKKCYILFSIDGIASPLLFGGIRMTIAGSLTLLFTMISTKSLPIPERKSVKSLLLLGTVNTGLVYFFEYIALNYCTGTNSSIVNSLQPMFLAIFAHIFFKNDKITIRKAIGIVIGFTGVVVCLTGNQTSSISFIGEGFIIISTMLFALGTNMSKKVTQKVSPAIASGYNLLIGGIELIIIGLILGGSITNGGVAGFSILAVLALISALCFLTWTCLCKANPVSRLAPFQFVNPLAGAVLSALILKENIFQVKYLVSLVLVSLGIIITNSTKVNES